MVWSLAKYLTVILLLPAAALVGVALNVGWHVLFPGADETERK